MGKFWQDLRLVLNVLGRRLSLNPDCIFCKIVEKKIPAQILFENDRILAFYDLHPQAPVHFLVIPKKHIPSLNEQTPEDKEVMGEILAIIPELARQTGISETGYRVIQNNGSQAGQTVFHIHFHVLEGRGMKWPPG